MTGRLLPRPGACWCRVLQSRLCLRRQGAGHTAGGKQGGQGESAIVVGLVLQDGLVSGETDAGWGGGEPAQVIAGGSGARSRSAQVEPVKPLLDAACGPARVGADETAGGDMEGGRVVLESMDSTLGGASRPTDEPWC